MERVQRRKLYRNYRELIITEGSKIPSLILITMAEYILKILKSNLMVMFSWGFHQPLRLPDNKGLAFKVQGFKYSGWVEVVYNEGRDLFEVVLTNTGKKVEDVYLDCLVTVIDNLVEHTDNYQNDVENYYKSIN
jgi:hypothetical protein